MRAPDARMHAPDMNARSGRQNASCRSACMLRTQDCMLRTGQECMLQTQEPRGPSERFFRSTERVFRSVFFRNENQKKHVEEDRQNCVFVIFAFVSRGVELGPTPCSIVFQWGRAGPDPTVIYLSWCFRFFIVFYTFLRLLAKSLSTNVSRRKDPREPSALSWRNNRSSSKFFVCTCRAVCPSTLL